MQTPQDVKNWYLNDSFNSTNSAKFTNYRIACVISPTTVTYLSFKNEPTQLYLGSNIEVIVTHTETKYRLLYYTYLYDSVNKNYLVGRTTYNLKDIIIDCKPYITSKACIFVAIGPANLDMANVIFTQAVKQDTILLNQTINYNSVQYQFSSIVDILTTNKRSTYLTNNLKGLNIYSKTPSNVDTYLSRTPSTLVFADSLVNKLKPT